MAEPRSLAVGADLFFVVSVEPEHLEDDGVANDALQHQVRLHRVQVCDANRRVKVLKSKTNQNFKKMSKGQMIERQFLQGRGEETNLLN